MSNKQDKQRQAAEAADKAIKARAEFAAIEQQDDAAKVALDEADNAAAAARAEADAATDDETLTENTGSDTGTKETAAAKAEREAQEAKARAESTASSEDFEQTQVGDKGWFKTCLGYNLAHPYQFKTVGTETAVELEHDGWVTAQLEAKLIRQVSKPLA